MAFLLVTVSETFPCPTPPSNQYGFPLTSTQWIINLTTAFAAAGSLQFLLRGNCIFFCVYGEHVLHFPYILPLPAVRSSRNLHCIFQQQKEQKFQPEFSLLKGENSSEITPVYAYDSRFYPYDIINNLDEFQENLFVLLWATSLSSHSFPWRNSVQLARVSSLSRLHVHTQTHPTWQDFPGRVITPTQEPGDSKHLHDRVFLCLVYL